MKSFKSFIVEEQSPKEGGNGKKISVGKSTVKINPNSEELKEVSPPGAKYERMVKHIKKSYSKGGLTDKEKSIAYATAWKQKNQDTQESAVPGQPAERLGAVTAIPADEREAAKQRTLAKAAALRKKREEQKEEFEIDEAIRNPESRKKLRDIMNTDKGRKGDASKGENPRSKYPSERSKQALNLLHGSGETGSKDNPVRSRGGTSAPPEERSRSAENRKYWAATAGPTRDRGAGNKAARRASELSKEEFEIEEGMGEMVSFSDFMEARRMDKEGVDRGDSRRADRAEKAKASLAAVKKGEERKIKVSKKYGVEPSKGDTVEKRAHKRDFAGSRQAPQEKGKKETPLETQNRRINAGNKRRMTHGWTSKEKAANRGMENAGSRFD
jgi:hypothetical protein